jgi:excisionase family DNA binding protein
MAALLTVEEAAAHLGLSTYQIQQAYRSKLLPSRRIGRLVRFTQDDLAAFIERSSSGSVTKPRPGGRRTA